MDDAIGDYKLCKLKEEIKIHSSYNLAVLPTEIAAEIKTYSNSRLLTNQTSARKLQLCSIDDHKQRRLGLKTCMSLI
jgi:hypothetical protein